MPIIRVNTVQCFPEITLHAISVHGWVLFDLILELVL